MSIRVAVYGFGPIGSLIAKSLLEKKGIELVGGVDIAPDKVGKDIGEFLGLGRLLNAKIVHDTNASNLFLETQPRVILHSTGTYLESIYPQLVKCIKAGAHVISTCETLVYPWDKYSELATSIDEMAKKYNVGVVGTGVNPGFIFDTLPIFLTSTCVDVKKIQVVRSIDAAKRRSSFQKKYGLSMTPEQFKEKMSRGEITAHVGYAESILLMASMLGVPVARVEEGQEPIVAERYIATEYFKINPGQVCGIRGYGIGYVNDTEFFKLELLAAAGREDYDEIVIEGNPPHKWRNDYGTSGDIATAAMVINMIPRILRATPGLITMKDTAIPSALLAEL